jgi:hypothetical protein
MLLPLQVIFTSITLKTLPPNNKKEVVCGRWVGSNTYSENNLLNHETTKHFVENVMVL